jgi:hypothetical protein
VEVYSLLVSSSEDEERASKKAKVKEVVQLELLTRLELQG